MDIGILERGGGDLKDRDHLEDPAEDDRIILKWTLKIGGYVDWIHLADYMGKWGGGGGGWGGGNKKGG